MDQNSEHKVTFGEEEFKRPTFSAPSRGSTFGDMVIKYSGGLVRNERQASYVLIGFVVFCLLFIPFFLSMGPEEATIEAPRGNKVLYPSDGPPRLEKPER